MGRMITVHIDSDDLKEMLFDRVAYWDDKIPHYDKGVRLFQDYYDELVDDGVFDDMKDFNVAVIVDNDIINNIDVLDKDELAERGIDPDNDEDGAILYSDGELFLIDARV